MGSAAERVERALEACRSDALFFDIDQEGFGVLGGFKVRGVLPLSALKQFAEERREAVELLRLLLAYGTEPQIVERGEAFLDRLDAQGREASE